MYPSIVQVFMSSVILSYPPSPHMYNYINEELCDIFSFPLSSSVTIDDPLIASFLCNSESASTLPGGLTCIHLCDLVITDRPLAPAVKLSGLFQKHK